MVILLLGPPGAGKGTQGARIAEQMEVPKISTGEIFRDLAAAGSPLGLEAKNFWTRGELVPDDIVVGLVKERIAAEDCANGFLLDGFPRTVRQAEILEGMLDDTGHRLIGVLDFKVDEAELLRRLSGRRMCANCGATYHVTALPPRVDDRCDHCGHALVQRADDSPESVRTRLREYEATTAPLLAFYRDRGLLRRIDANASPDTIFERVDSVLEELKKT